MKSNKTNSKHKKLVDVKGTVVNDQDGAYFRKQHQRNQMVNQQPTKHPWITSKLNNTMRAGEVQSISDLKIGEGGITPGVKVIEIKTPEGQTTTGFFKDIDSEPFTLGGFIRDTIRLNDKKTGDTINDRDAYRDLKQEKDHGRAKVKGHMLDREVATFTLGQALGMDHLPEASVRRLEIDGEKKLGIMIRNIHDQFKEPGYTITKAKHADYKYNDFDSIADYDPKIGDKLAFDLLIGNTDRHRGN